VHPSPTARPLAADLGPGDAAPSPAPPSPLTRDPQAAQTAPAALTDWQAVAVLSPVIVAAIPARWASTRLPGKPLLPIAGRPMIEHVYRRVMSARGLARVVVLTDDERIAVAVAGFGGEVEMTPADCASGTDRIAHAARRWPTATAVVNVQGDEPLIDPEAVSAVAAHLATHPGDPMVTLATPIVMHPLADAGAPAAGGPAALRSELGEPGDPGNLGDIGKLDEVSDLDNPHVVKVVTGRGGLALYFSRSAIPYQRQPGAAMPLRHLGIYGYQRATLLRLADLPPTPLERSEALEQLRALEHGIPIRVLVTGRGSPGVDTAEDLEHVERLLAPDPR
jgi:3-deoxy-manno-octulosonate cytidylyltransferase (CMP-KDO synthetase)